MNFEGEHLLIGQFGHFFVILGFVASLIATIAFFSASRQQDPANFTERMGLARGAFIVQFVSIAIIFTLIFYICSNHLFEYMYAYKHASKELEYKYLLACIWEGQEGSFLLWSVWHGVLGLVFIVGRNKAFAKGWEAPVMAVISLAQFFLLMMILGIYVGEVKLGSSPFALTRNEINAPIFNQANYLNFIKDGLGLNVLLRNYWMVIHPPVLFLGFASCIVPFAYAYAGLQTKKFGDWVKPALPFMLFTAAILGVGIMMGGKWAYESLSFGGYWAWDPVENASLVPWLMLIAGMHTMVIYKATGHSLRASYIFVFLSLGFILYSTFLARTGILGETSVHSFTEAGKAINVMIGLFVLAFTIPPFLLLFKNYNKIPTIIKEERTDSREFWMFIGSLVFFLSGIFIIAKTSFPVYNKLFGTSLAPPQDNEFSYNKVIVLVAIIIGLLTAITQYLKYKQTPKGYLKKGILIPTLVSIAATAALVFFYPFQFYKHGAGFLGAIYVASFAAIYAVISNSYYIFSVLKGKMLFAGGSISHAGFTLMILGMLISSSNKEVISSSTANGITLPGSTDPMTKKEDDPKENLTLIRTIPTKMASYEVTYLNDSMGNEKGRKFFHLMFTKKDADTKEVKETFRLQPDVYMMKDNNMSSNPDTKSYYNKDVFTYVSYAINEKNSETDTASFVIKELAPGDTAFYSNGYIILNKVVKNPITDRYQYTEKDLALMADITVFSKDSVKYTAQPLIEVQGEDLVFKDDTLFAQNLYLRFAGVAEDQHIKLGVKESDRLIDFVTVKTYVFPYIKLVWLGLIVMAMGMMVSMVRRSKRTNPQMIAILLASAVGLIYMFFIANP